MRKPIARSSYAQMLRIALAALLLSTQVAAVAAAVPPAGAREFRRLFREAAWGVRQKRYRKALRLYQEALAISPLDVDLYFNLYTMAKTLRRCPLVLGYGRAYLYLDPSGPDAPEVRRTVDRCAGRIPGELGTVTIRSEPEGAELFIDGVLLGRTPLLELPLPAGGHELRMTHPECEPKTLSFTLEHGIPLDLRPEMTRKLLYGYLMVRTKPADGVKVFLDEELVGQTPLAAPLRAQTKRYLLRLELPEWDRWVRYVTIRPDATTEVEAELEQTEGDTPAPAPVAPKPAGRASPILRR